MNRSSGARRVAGDALKDVEYVMSEVNVADMPKKNNATYQQIALEYLSNWEERGFSIHICDNRQSCFDMPVTNASDAVGVIERMGIANALMVQPVA